MSEFKQSEESNERNIRLENLRDLFRNFDGDMKNEFIQEYPDLWDDCYDIMEESRYHRVMIRSMEAGYLAGMKDPEANAGLLDLAWEALDLIEKINMAIRPHRFNQLPDEVKFDIYAMSSDDLNKLKVKLRERGK